MFKLCLNLPPRYCWAEMQAVWAVSEPTSRHLGVGVQAVISDVGIYLPGTVG